jgi:UPF0042 nucleotide-binding protein
MGASTLEDELKGVLALEFSSGPGLPPQESISGGSGIASLLVVGGISGAGSTTALRIVSDLGYYALDNLPTGLFPAFLKLEMAGGFRYKHLAIIFDTSSAAKVRELEVLLNTMREYGVPVNSIFLDASNEKLLQRYSETRRPHPVYDPLIDQSLSDTIERERVILAPLRKVASIIIDTTLFTVHDLKRTLTDFISNLRSCPVSSVFLVLQSFGFKYGAPALCDIMLDVRFLNNPYFVPELKESTGLDRNVFDYVMGAPEAGELEAHFLELLQFLIPRYVREGKSLINVCIGCTGGKHRSVSLVQSLLGKLSFDGVSVTPMHRDVSR